jgi:hypothetical protein
MTYSTIFFLIMVILLDQFTFIVLFFASFSLRRRQSDSVDIVDRHQLFTASIENIKLMTGFGVMRPVINIPL